MSERTAYLTGVSTELTRTAGRSDLGLLVSPDNSVHRQLDAYERWGADNGQYTASKKGEPFDPDRWLSWLEELPRRDAAFVALPDVLEWKPLGPEGELVPVGNLAATLELSARWVDAVVELGFTPALVAQDGLVTLAQVPFADKVGALFVGGSDGYKLGPDAAAVIAEAKARGWWVHVGRVNSGGRLAYVSELGADSADGTYIGQGPTVNGPKVLGWLDMVNGDDLAAKRAARNYRKRLVRQGVLEEAA